jgi:hypothetical protein
VSLPVLLSRKDIAERLNVKLPTAETIMRDCPLVPIGRRVYVREEDVLAYLKRKSSSMSGGTS